MQTQSRQKKLLYSTRIQPAHFQIHNFPFAFISHPPFVLALFLICLLLVSSTATINTTDITTLTCSSSLSALHAHAHAHRTSSPTSVLNPRQRQVLNHIYHQSNLRHDYSEETDPAQILTSHFPALLPNLSDAQRVVQFLLESAPVIIHLHLPQVLHHWLLDDSEESHCYRNFFEINMTNTRASFPRRFSFESALFDGLYDDVAHPSERVKYGFLELGSDKYFANYYGYSHLQLKPSVRYRSSYSYGDSGAWKGALKLTVLETLIPEQIISKWTTQDMKLLMVAAAAATGDKEVEADVKEHLRKYDEYQRKRGLRAWFKREPPQVCYIEAQIHGPIDLRRDLSALVVDRYYQGNTTLVKQLDAFTAKFGVPLQVDDGSSQKETA